LSLIHRFLKGISVVQGGLPPTANSLALHWLDEAETSIRLSPPLKRSDGAREAIGRIYSFEPPTRNFLCFEREEVARLAPPEDFIVRLNPELAQRLRFARLRLAITDPEGDLTLEEFRSYVARHGRTGAGTLAEMFVRGWSEQRATPEEDPEVERLRNMGAFIPSAPKGLPQTRAVQEVTLREFKKLVVELEKIAGVPLKPEEKAAAFVRIHSPTEVFQLEQIESVFGPAENIDFSSLSTLLETMRGRLAGDWSDTGTQQKAGTHRTESEVIAEASRGYSLAADLIRRNKPRLEAGWKAHLQEAVLLFDAAEFHFKHQGALVDYVSERKSALEALEKTARNYIASVPNLRPSEWSLDPFLAWTSAMLGATDPKRLVWKENRAEPAFSKVHELLHSLPEPARTQHLRDFATLAHKTAETVPAHMRYKFVEALVQVIGAEIRELKPCLDLLQHYRSLTEEARLRAYFDGSKTVQHGQTFGVILALEHTEKLHREAGGFSKYLQNPGALNQNNPFVFFGLRNAKQMNYRDEFQKNIQKALQDAFEVISMTFHDPAVQPRPLPEAGWQATPLVYLALRTKDLSVDRLPPIQMDLEFAEGRAQVVLPIASQLEPMVTSTELLPPRPLQKLELLLTLDERDWVRGKLTLDINGKGHGVLPDLQTLFQSAELEGFTLTTAEQQNSVTQFVSDKDGLRAVCERNWQLTFQRKTDFHGDVMFRFPGMRDGIEGKVEYKHFVDADLFEIRSDKALGGIRLGRGRDTALRWTAGLVLVLALISGLIRWRHLWLPARAPVREGGPEVVTPLSVISFLRDQLEKADAVPIRECLQKSIRDLEERCFSARPNPPSESELLVKITTAREMLARSSST
jgi:hypothetical protein